MAAAIPRTGRIVIVAALSIAGAVQVVRSAVATRYVSDNPALAARAWPGHPRVQTALAMAAIGRSAAAGAAPSAATVDQVMRAAQRAPMAIEPFLVRGAIAESRQRGRDAERLFAEAARRDPRSSAARYFLAERYLSSGRPAEGLRQASVLVRLVAGGPGALVPAIAQYARSPGAVAALRPTFAANPGLRDMVLSELASDPGNSPLVMALAADEAGQAKGGIPPAWQAQLLTSMVEQGNYAGAHDLWLRVSGLKAPQASPFNPQFARLTAPAPFNWTFGSGDFGVAEPAAGGGLQILYYGRTNADFATQIMLLRAGTYALTMNVTRSGDAGGDRGSGLAWSISCLPAGRMLLSQSLGGAGSNGAIAGRFTVPTDCAAQTIKLSGHAQDLAAAEQATIRNLAVGPVMP